MINTFSFRSLFTRYVALHRAIPQFSRKVRTHDGKPFARIERERVSGNMHCVEGWTLAHTILILSGHRTIYQITPSIRREAVEKTYGSGPQPGFQIQIPLVAEADKISFIATEETVTCALQKPNRFRFALENLRLFVCLIWVGLCGFTAARTYLRSPDQQERDAAKKRLKTLLDLTEEPARDHLFDSQSLGLGTSTSLTRNASDLTIILPIYNAFELLQECLTRIAAHTTGKWHLIAIEDASTDPRVRPYLKDWATTQSANRVTVLENDENLGFIGSVNRGFTEALTKEAPVVLLNTDALLPKSWDLRLLAPFSDPSVASTTPMSNDAEILNAPIICQPNQLPIGTADHIDAAAKILLKGAPNSDLPTAVGFCMGIALNWLAQVPRFDSIFGKGYGEEVDWSQAISAKGGRHVAVPDLFVEHRGGQSFGSKKKANLIATNGKIITSRYPKYDAQVQEFIMDDPLIGPRLLLGLASLTGTHTAPIPVYLCHSLGGGAEDAMQRQIQDDLGQKRSSVVLRLGGRFRYKVELHTPDGVTYGQSNEDTVIDHLLCAIPQRHLIYICGVGDLNAASLPERMLRWSAPENCNLTIEIHDFFPISPAYNLLNSTGQYTGPPNPKSHNAPEHNFRNRNGDLTDLRAWQAAWAQALNQAETIIVFSRNSRDILCEIWPDLHARIVIRPHSPLHDVPTVTRTLGHPVRTIGVLGNIGFQKGAGVLQEMSRHLQKTRSANLVVIGNIDPTYPLVRPTIVHGSYRREDIAQLAESYGIDCWFIPSIWPETFSFTTREALATGLPVWTFDLGAQAEALREAGQEAHILPLDGLDDVQQTLRRILKGS